MYVLIKTIKYSKENVKVLKIKWVTIKINCCRNKLKFMVNLKSFVVKVFFQKKAVFLRDMSVQIAYTFLLDGPVTYSREKFITKTYSAIKLWFFFFIIVKTLNEYYNDIIDYIYIYIFRAIMKWLIGISINLSFIFYLKWWCILTFKKL